MSIVHLTNVCVNPPCVGREGVPPSSYMMGGWVTKQISYIVGEWVDYRDSYIMR